MVLPMELRMRWTLHLAYAQQNTDLATMLPSVVTSAIPAPRRDLRPHYIRAMMALIHNPIPIAATAAAPALSLAHRSLAVATPLVHQSHPTPTLRCAHQLKTIGVEGHNGSAPHWMAIYITRAVGCRGLC